MCLDDEAAAWVQSLHARAYAELGDVPACARTTTTRMRRIHSTRVVHAIQDELIASDAARLVDAYKCVKCVEERPPTPTNSAVAACCCEAKTYRLHGSDGIAAPIAS